MCRSVLPRAVAVTTAAVVVAGLAATTNAGAAPASSKKAPGIKTSSAKIKGKGEARDGLPAGVPKKGSYTFLLKLDSASTLSAEQKARPKGKAAARQAAKKQFATVKRQQTAVSADLPSGSKVIYKTHAVLSGVAVRTNVKNFAALRKIDGVAAVYPVAPKKLSNSYAVPLQGAPQAWVSAGDRGQNATIAVLDTGIDYTHANFGGPGTVAAYEAAHKTEAQAADPKLFPTAKIAGGYDLVGDAYDGSGDSGEAALTPHPDPNPLDCEGHGSHVAGSATGLGENADGSTYTGKYNNDTPFDTMKIGPGIAPLAKLYAYRVFGCAGSTNVVAAAIDRAADPNQDGDPSDRVDVINMSLGSDFGSPQDGDSVATNAASDKGIVMAVAAGNNGDLYDTGGSPGNAVKAIGVAASQDAQSVVDSLNVGNPLFEKYAAERSIAYDYTKGDLKGVVADVSSANDDGCAPFSAADKAAVKGKIAFLEWTDDDTERACGSVARGANAQAAGAIGFIFANDEENFAAGITGDAKIPGVLVAKSGGDAIRAELAAGNPVTITGTTRNGFTQDDPALNDTIANFSSRGTRGSLDGSDVAKPDVTAVGGTVFSTSNGTGNDGENESGTSMATPMTAGTAAIVRSLHPEWSAEQVKADIMNTAGQNLFKKPNHEGKKYAPNRVGTGRIDVKAAANNKVLAYNTDNPGGVGASFGPIEVTADTTKTRTIKVENTGLTAATYDVSYQARTSIPGAVYSVSPATVTVDPRSSKKVTVTLTLTKAQLTKTIDGTVDRLQGGLPREYVADASGLVVLKGKSVPNLRVPVYSAPRPASTMTQPSSVSLPSGSTQTATVPLSGGRVNQGTGAERITSAVAGFELQATSPALPACSATVTSKCVNFADEKGFDLKYVGATSSAPQVRSIGNDPLTSSDGLAYFAVATHGPSRTPAGFGDIEVYIDSTGDGIADAVTYNTRITGTDVLVAQTVNLKTGAVLDLQGIDDRLGDTDAAVFDSDTLIMPVSLAALPGVAAGKSRISYSVLSFSGYQAGQVDQVGDVEVDAAGNNKLVKPLSMDVLNPGVAVYGSYNGDASPLLYADSPGTILQVRRDAKAYAADKGQGVLMLHLHNKVGEKAQVVSIAKRTPTVSIKASPNPAKKNKPVTFTVTVTGADGVVPTGTITVRRTNSPAQTVGTATLSNGVGKVTYTPKSSGTFPYQASYSGDGYFAAATSKAGPVKINP